MLKKFFASVCLVLALSSAFLVPCFGATNSTSAADYVMTVFVGDQSHANPVRDNQALHVPSAEYKYLTAARIVSNYYGIYFNVYSNSFEPANYDRTVYLNLTLLTDGTNDAYLAGSDKPDMIYTTQESNVRNTYVDAVEWKSFAASTGGACFKVTIPAGASSFYFTTQNYLHFNVYGSNVNYTIASFGAYIINSSDAGVLGAVESILSHVQSIDGNILNMVSAVNMILDQMTALNADTDTIISMLGTLEELSSSQLQTLEYISSSVDAIYHFLTQEMVEESNKLSEQAGTISQQIDTQTGAEEQYTLTMEGSFNQLALDGFSFGTVEGAMILVGNIFKDMWSAFGDYVILFVYPLVLGICLLVIGRLSKSGGGNSSRNSEHKGGEGGA